MKNHVSIAVASALSASLLTAAATLTTQDVKFPEASPNAVVRQQVGLTSVEVEYYRPGAKGRQVFGGLVPFGEIWRTGANNATKITFSDEVSFGGDPVPAGTYAFFTIPGEQEWTFILNKVTEQWGSYAYDESNDVVRVKARAHSLAEPIETMSISLENLRDASADLTITWDKTRVSLPIQTNLVETLVPQIEAAMSQGGAQTPYLQAAMFYFEHDVDLTKSIEWIDKALAANPEAVWILYRKGLVLQKLGETEAARDVATMTIDKATATGGELGAEYVRLAKALLAKLEG